MKKCTKCQQHKPLQEFGKQSKNKDGLRYHCKLCCKIYRKQYYLATYEKNKETIKEKAKQYYYQNKHKEEYKEKVRARVRRSYYKHAEKRKAARKRWMKENRDRINTRKKELYRTSEIYRLSEILRSRLLKALKTNQKKSKTLDYLGCSVDTLKNHLEKQFQDGMTWENQGQWHIDHIRPLSSFDLTNESEIFEACHYSNLQPLWAEDNLRKGAKVVDET